MQNERDFASEARVRTDPLDRFAHDVPCLSATLFCDTTLAPFLVT